MPGKCPECNIETISIRETQGMLYEYACSKCGNSWSGRPKCGSDDFDGGGGMNSSDTSTGWGGCWIECKTFGWSYS